MDFNCNSVSCTFIPAYRGFGLAHLLAVSCSRCRNNRYSHYRILMEIGASGLAYSSAFAFYFLGL